MIKRTKEKLSMIKVASTKDHLVGKESVIKSLIGNNKQQGSNVIRTQTGSKPLPPPKKSK